MSSARLCPVWPHGAAGKIDFGLSLRGYDLGFDGVPRELKSAYRDKPRIMTVDGLKGAKIRVTGSQLGRIAMKLLGIRPVPVAWSDTLFALSTGLIDGAEIRLPLHREEEG